MAETVTMPKLGFDMAEGTLVRWVKVEGDKVNKGDVLAEIETDKATVEVESDFSGVVAKELVREGDIVPVGTPIAIIAQPGEKVDQVANAQAETGLKLPGDLHSPRMESEKPVAETRSQVSVAAASQQTHKEHDQAAMTSVEAIPMAEATRTEEMSEGDDRLKASPLARKLAGEKGIDLYRVIGTGSGGRIVRSDVEAAIQTGQQPALVTFVPAPDLAAKSTSPATPKIAPIPLAPIFQDAFHAPQDQTIKVNRLRAAIGRRTVASKQQVPHFYITR